MGEKGFRLTMVLAAAAAVLAIAAGPASALSPVQPHAEIVYTQENRLASVAADGTNRTILTRPLSKFGWNGSFNSDYDPQISPDGHRLLFGQWKGSVVKETRLMVANRDASGAKPVFAVNGIQDLKHGSTKYISIVEPTWSAASGRIFFIFDVDFSDRRGYSTGIHKVMSIKPDGTDRRVHLVKHSAISSAHPPRGSGSIDSVEPSPDGKHLLLEVYNDRNGDNNILVLDLKTGNTRFIREGEDPTWSPSGSKIAFVSGFEKLGVRYAGSKGEPYTDTRVYVMKADGTRLKRLVRGYGPGREEDPDWSPDGRRILFTSDRNDREESGFDPTEIYTIGVDGKCLSWVTNGIPAASDASWGPEAIESAPASCGGQGLGPEIGYHPLRFKNESRSGPEVHFWLGPEFRGALYTGGDHRYIGYSDCAYFNPKDCHGDWGVNNERVCGSWDRDEFEYSGVATGLMVRRGAILMPRTYEGEASSVTVFSGGAEIEVAGGSFIQVNGGATLEDHLEAVDALRPIGQDEAKGDLAAGVLDSRLPKLASRVKDSFVSTGSVQESAKALKLSEDSVRSYLRIQSDLETIGPVATKTCS